MALHKDQRTELPIPRYEDTLLPARSGEQFRTSRPVEARLSGRNNVMSPFCQKPNGNRVDILIGQESHGVAATWISSTATTSIAYWMQTRISSG